MEKLISYSPVTLESVGSVDITPVDELPNILDRSGAAQAEWIAMDRKERISKLTGLRKLIASDAERIARTAYLETGKPRADAFNTEVLTSVAMVKECERWLKGFGFTEKVDQGSMGLLTWFLGRRSYLEYRPLGVVAVISPYNFPIAIPFTETVMAVTAGNAVILKPSSDTPLCGHLIQDLFDEAGFPEGLVQTISGPGVGSALSKMDVDKIIFTGSTDTGRSIMKEASDRLVPLTLELGGKDAAIIFDDADIDRTVAGTVWGSFVNSGQVCVGIKRILVQSTIFDQFIEEFVKRVKELKQGDGWDDASISIGPMINATEMDRMKEICEQAIASGGTILTGGNIATDLNGHFFEPTVIVDVPHDAAVVKDEIFGPVVMIFPFEDENDAVRLATDNDFALGGSVWTSDLEKGRRVAVRMRSGSVDVNNTSYTFGLPATPWGGRKNSGFGTTHGSLGFKDLMFPHHIHVDKARFRRDPWWMPYDPEKTEIQENMIDSLYGSGKGKLKLIRSLFPILRNRK